MSIDALRIALLTHSLNPRGGVVHTLELASSLSARPPSCRRAYRAWLAQPALVIH
ncbi:hypothetical protein [Paraburkholderia sp. DGU8]|uniref:hypothetical protein n=1 Tax=Paraburkholderia sp. DGU8 TaxID=3161997 RepID=UPI0034678AED